MIDVPIFLTINSQTLKPTALDLADLLHHILHLLKVCNVCCALSVENLRGCSWVEDRFALVNNAIELVFPSTLGLPPETRLFVGAEHNYSLAVIG